MPFVLHLPTLMAVVPPATEIDNIGDFLRCPKCGSDQIMLTWIRPPAMPAKRERKMQEVGPGEWWLGRYSGAVMLRNLSALPAAR